MRCLITGADGRLGRALTRAMTGRPDLTVWSLPKDRLDITSRSALERCMREFRPDWVVNAAAVTRAPEDRLYEYDRVNAEGAGFVAEATRAAGARILQVSTDYVFSGEGEAPWCERDRPSARGPYGRSKEEGEYAVMRSGAIPSASSACFAASPSARGSSLPCPPVVMHTASGWARR